MKKILALLLTFSILFTVTACGASEKTSNNDKSANNDSNESSTQKNDTPKPEKLFNLIDIDNYEIKIDDPYVDEKNNSMSISKSYTLKTENKFTADKKIKIENTEITFNLTTVKDFLAEGWEISDSAANYQLAANICTKSMAKNKNGKTADIFGLNNTNDVAVFSDCVINRVSIDYHYSIEKHTAELTYGSLNFNKNTTYDDVLSAFGEPECIFVTEHYDNGVYTYSNIQLNYEQKDTDYKTDDCSVEMEFRDENNQIEPYRFSCEY